MSTPKGRILRLLSGLVLKRATVTSAQDVGGFRRLCLGGDLPPFPAGAKVQVLLPSDDTRTYTPIASAAGTVLLAWTHAGGPGARWMAGVAAGAEVTFVGPQRSLALPPGPVVLVGDETSVAVAAAYEAERPGQVRAVIQAGPQADVPAAAASVGLRAVQVVARGDHAATAAAVVAQLASVPQATVALTGSSALVVAVRSALKGAGVRSVTTKAYWIPGRTGLD